MVFVKGGGEMHVPGAEVKGRAPTQCVGKPALNYIRYCGAGLGIADFVAWRSKALCITPRNGLV